ncbi:MAG: hypothetical protein V4493_12320 [Pseudomonadota bacterium]
MGTFGVAPSEFWRMHPEELWWFVEAKIPAEFDENQTDWDALLELLESASE